ncbi:hypothetical protein OF83DRAFT_1111584 [Amylostereum chailletii]|nr:hypothetical protein OF83DRAFT_1111584 [Amylostereum chailletii]
MFTAAVQPATVSIFSSTGSDPLCLWSQHTDPELTADSFICFIVDDKSSPTPPAPATLITPHSLPSSNEVRQQDSPVNEGRTITQTVLHIQSPTLRTTFIRCPPIGYISAASSRSNRVGQLSLRHPWLHMQVRNLGRAWSFEVGLVDQAGKEGVVRCSTFQTSPAVKLRPAASPLLHLPLAFPDASSTPLTSWTTLSLHLPSLLPHFSSASLVRDDDRADEDEDEDMGDRRNGAIPSGAFSHVSYTKVYATCRVRRVWFAQTPVGSGKDIPWEFQLYAE